MCRRSEACRSVEGCTAILSLEERCLTPAMCRHGHGEMQLALQFLVWRSRVARFGKVRLCFPCGSMARGVVTNIKSYFALQSLAWRRRVLPLQCVSTLCLGQSSTLVNGQEWNATCTAILSVAGNRSQPSEALRLFVLEPLQACDCTAILKAEEMIECNLCARMACKKDIEWWVLHCITTFGVVENMSQPHLISQALASTSLCTATLSLEKACLTPVRCGASCSVL
jgi:hypothetical protein